MKRALISCYPADAYAKGEMRINHGVPPEGTVKQIIFAVSKLRRNNPTYTICVAIDMLAPKDVERKMAEAFLELGATMRPCGLGDRRYIDFVLGSTY